MVICLGRGADLHMAQLMPLPLTIFFFLTSRLVFQPDSPGQSLGDCKTVVVVIMVRGMNFFVFLFIQTEQFTSGL